MKLSPAQQAVVEKMRAGWELGFSEPMGPSQPCHCWLQKNGIGRGGEMVRVAFGTFNALRARGLIQPKRQQYPSIVYGLVEAAAEAGGRE